ncbi:hypothetical protein E0K89_019305 [Aquicoccus sp. SCR17]|nr:hypothetical protein [Carideicomes alvinocaridis]
MASRQPPNWSCTTVGKSPASGNCLVIISRSSMVMEASGCAGR